MALGTVQNQRVGPYAGGRTVNPLEGLQNSVGGLLDMYMKDVAQKREDQHRAEQTARANEQLAMQRTKHEADMKAVADEQKAREFLGSYDPRIGQHSNNVQEGLRGIYTSQQEAMADDAAPDIKNILKSYGVGRDKSIGDLSAEQQIKLGAELGGKANAAVGSLTPTREEVQTTVLRDVLKNTGNFELATKLSEGYGLQYNDKKTLLEREQAAADKQNEAIKRAQDLLVKQAEINARSGKSTKKDKISYSSDAPRDYEEMSRNQGDRYNVSLLNSWKIGDAGTAKKLINMGAQHQINPRALDRAIREGIDYGFWGNSFKQAGMTGEDAIPAILAQAKYYENAHRGTSGGSDTTFRLLPTVKSKSLEDIMQEKGIAAARAGFGNRSAAAIATTPQTMSTRLPPAGSTPAPQVEGQTPTGGQGSRDGEGIGGTVPVGPKAVLSDEEQMRAGFAPLVANEEQKTRFRGWLSNQTVDILSPNIGRIPEEYLLQVQQEREAASRGVYEEPEALATSAQEEKKANAERVSNLMTEKSVYGRTPEVTARDISLLRAQLARARRLPDSAINKQRNIRDLQELINGYLLNH